MRSFFLFIFWLIKAPFRLAKWLIKKISIWLASTVRKVRGFFTEEIEDEPISEALSKTIENPMGVLEHLDALRKHLLRSVLFLAITTAFSFIFFHQILIFLSKPLPGGIKSLVAIEVTEPIGTVMKVTLLSGFTLAFPYIALELWMFIAPGLHRRSRIVGLLAIPIAVLFFVGGMAFGYYIMLPTALPFLLNFMGISTIPRPSSYISFVTSLMFWIGVAFEFPLLIFVLANIGLIKADSLAKQWRLAIVIIAVVAAVITPTVDPVNMSLVMGPMIVLYFFSVLLAKIAERRRSKKQTV
jgi:sec-independent protein translocase protein TatC